MRGTVNGSGSGCSDVTCAGLYMAEHAAPAVQSLLPFRDPGGTTDQHPAHPSSPPPARTRPSSVVAGLVERRQLLRVSERRVPMTAQKRLHQTSLVGPHAVPPGAQACGCRGGQARESILLSWEPCASRIGRVFLRPSSRLCIYHQATSWRCAAHTTLHT